jgi:hypothetical protein
LLTFGVEVLSRLRHATTDGRSTAFRRCSRTTTGAACGRPERQNGVYSAKPQQERFSLNYNGW